jgi:oligopeptide transport system substrate-binding protein
MKRRSCVPLVLVLVLLSFGAALVASCGSGGGTATTGSPSAAASPKAGGTLTFAIEGEPQALDPIISWTVQAFDMEYLLYDTLVKFASGTGEAGNEVVPALATDMPTVSADGKTYTFTLRQGAMFAPPVSREVTAEDFKYSVERMMSTKRSPATFFYTGIAGAADFQAGKAKEITGIKAVDPYTVEIKLEAPDPTLLFKLTMPFCAVVPKEWVEKYGRSFARHPLGSGPYLLEKWTAGQDATLVRNPNYSGPTPGYPDSWHFDFTLNPEMAFLQVQRGTVDILGNGVPPGDVQRVMQDPKLKALLNAGPIVAWFYGFLNVTVKPFDDVRVRQAVNYAIDRPRIAKILSGQVSPLNQIYPEGMPGHEPNADYYPYDPAKARQLLSEAGLAGGFSTTFITFSQDPLPRVSEAIQADLAKVGIKVAIKRMQEAAGYTYITTKASQAPMGLTYWYADFPDPSDWIGSLLSKESAMMTDGGANVSWWWSPEVEKLYAQAQTMQISPERTALFTQMQKIVMDEAPVFPLYQPIYNGMASEATGGFYIHPMAVFNFLDYWRK